jgi:hypothetical protein
MSSVTNTVVGPGLAIPGQVFSVGAIIGTLFNVLPPAMGLLAAVIGTLFYAIMLWESKTVQSWVKGREYVRLKARQAATARVLLRAQAATARALLDAQKAEADALKAAQEQVADA